MTIYINILCFKKKLSIALAFFFGEFNRTSMMVPTTNNSNLPKKKTTNNSIRLTKEGNKNTNSANNIKLTIKNSWGYLWHYIYIFYIEIVSFYFVDHSNLAFHFELDWWNWAQAKAKLLKYYFSFTLKYQ